MFRNGKWFASITVQCSPVRKTGTESVEIDLGCKDAITFRQLLLEKIALETPQRMW